MKRYLSLCCGAGGMDLGFQLAGLAGHHVGVDNWQLALATYRLNIVDSETVWASLDPRDAIKTFTPVFDITTIGHVDILLMSPPCPTFSGANINGDRKKDPTLVKACLAIRDFLKPRWWILEESPFAAHLVEVPRFIKAVDHGAFQIRKRLYAGNYPGILPTRPRWKIHPAIRAQEDKAFNQNMKWSKKAKSCCQWFGRKLESWELQALMGFPLEFTFLGDYAERCVQIGNAVFVPVVKAIAEAIIKAEAA